MVYDDTITQCALSLAFLRVPVKCGAVCVCVSNKTVNSYTRDYNGGCDPPEPPSSPSLCAYSGSVSVSRQLFEMVRDKEKKETLSLIKFFCV